MKTELSPPVTISGTADLWCTYAAIRTLSWLGRLGDDPGRAESANFLRRSEEHTSELQSQ